MMPGWGKKAAVVLAVMGSFCTAGCTLKAHLPDVQNFQHKAQTGEEENVITLTMFIQNQSKYTGLQEDPVAKYIEEKFGIRLELTVDASLGNTSAHTGTFYDLLQTKLMSNDLDDIMYFGSPAENHEVWDNLKKAAKGGLILPLDELANEYAPGISGDPRLAVRNEYRRKAVYEDGDYYSLGGQGGVCADQLPGAAAWVRWDIYSELGYPAAATDDEFLKLLEEMQKYYVSTPSGEKVYGFGGAFGEEGLGDSFILRDYPLTKGYEAVGGNYAVYLNHAEKTIEDPLTDADSFFWNGVRFYYKANQMGLLDPDAADMKISEYKKKINQGVYLASLNGWQVMEKESILAGKGMKDAGYMPIKPFEDVKTVPVYWERVLGLNEFAISGKCKHPEKAMEFLDWCFSEEGSRVITQGARNLAWEEQEGEEVLTKQYERDDSLGITDMAEVYGTGKYTGLNGYSDRDLDKKGSYIQPEYNTDPSGYSAVEKDALSFYGTKSFYEYFSNYTNGKGERLPNIIWSSYLTEIGNPPEEIIKKSDRINAYMNEAVFRCIYAADDLEFEELKRETMKAVKELDANGVTLWYSSRFQEVREGIDGLMDEALEAYRK